MSVTFLSTTNGITKSGYNNSYLGRPITEIITNGFFTVDNKWTVKYWNKAAETLLGVPAKDIVGKNLWEEFAGIIPVGFYAVYHKAFLQDTPIHFEEYWGEMGAWFDIVTYYYDDTLSVSFKNRNQLTQGVQVDQQLKTLNELYRLVTEITKDCLWEWDLMNREMFWIDGGHKRVFGYQVENALIPQSFWENRLHPDDRTRVLASLDKTISKGSVPLWEIEYRFKKSDGSYAHVYDRGHIIYDGDNKASRMVGATEDITEKVLLEEKLVQERLATQREITAAVLTAQEKERADIGRELHDNLNQILAVAKLYMQMAKIYDEKRDIHIDKCCRLLEDVMEEIRKIAKNLVIPGTHIIGLFDNIKNLLYDLMKVDPIRIEFYQNGLKEEDLNAKLQLAILRIVQEQVNNILTHAGATSATINLSKEKEGLILLISDNGKGCDISKEKSGVGIINIKSRVELYDGTVTIMSKPGEGYKLKVVLPLSSLV